MAGADKVIRKLKFITLVKKIRDQREWVVDHQVKKKDVYTLNRLLRFDELNKSFWVGMTLGQNYSLLVPISINLILSLLTIKIDSCQVYRTWLLKGGLWRAKGKGEQEKGIGVDETIFSLFHAEFRF